METIKNICYGYEYIHYLVGMRINFVFIFIGYEDGDEHEFFGEGMKDNKGRR